MPLSSPRQIMVIDMLEGFTRRGPLASPRVAALLPLQAAFLSRLTGGDRVVFVSDAHGPNDPEFRRFPPHCLGGSDEALVCRELIRAVPPAVRVEHVTKTTFSGFHETDLGELVQAADSNEWIVIGCVTDCCLEANVADLVYRGCEVTVIRDLIDTWHDPPDHDADAINAEWFDRRFPTIWGARVLTGWKELLFP
ncbi:MAG: cysteine hydrolase [Planctomycetes bacterium]|nr:cysteine hydrolase [Planctomycetota bacterium]